MDLASPLAPGALPAPHAAAELAPMLHLLGIRERSDRVSTVNSGGKRPRVCQEFGYARVGGRGDKGEEVKTQEILKYT